MVQDVDLAITSPTKCTGAAPPLLTLEAAPTSSTTYTKLDITDSNPAPLIVSELMCVDIAILTVPQVFDEMHPISSTIFPSPSTEVLELNSPLDCTCRDAHKAFTGRALWLPVLTSVQQGWWLPLPCSHLRHPWPPPCQAHSSGMFLGARKLQNAMVALVELKPWPSWELPLLDFAVLSNGTELRSCLQFATDNSKSLLPWDPGVMQFDMWDIMLLLQYVPSDEWLTSPWDPGQHADGTRIKLRPLEDVKTVVYTTSGCNAKLQLTVHWQFLRPEDFGGSGTLTDECMLLGSMEELISMLFSFLFHSTTLQSSDDALQLQSAGILCPSLPPATPPDSCDTCGIPMTHNSLLGVLFLGAFVVQRHCTIVKVPQFYLREMSSRNYAMLCVDQIMLKRYLIDHGSDLHHHSSSGNAILLQTAAANGHSEMVKFLQSRRGTDKSDCGASPYFAVYSVYTDLNSASASDGMVVDFLPGLVEG